MVLRIRSVLGLAALAVLALVPLYREAAREREQRARIEVVQRASANASVTLAPAPDPRVLAPVTRPRIVGQEPSAESAIDSLHGEAQQVMDAPAAHSGRVREEDEATRPAGPTIDAAYGRLPLHFERNDGQTDGSVKYLARGDGYAMFLTGDEAVLSLRPGRSRTEHDLETLNGGEPWRDDATNEPPAVVRARLVGARKDAKVSGEAPLRGKSNYFIGNDSSKWRANVPQFGRVTYQEVWPGIDLTYYGNQRQLEYDFVVAPGADPGLIHVAYDGVEGMCLDDAGNLVLQIGSGELMQRAPVVYQSSEDGRRVVDARFVLAADASLGFEIGVFDRSLPLVIDPVLVYSTYLGGGGQDYGGGIALDGAGNAYVSGYASSGNFPTQGGFQTSFQGGDSDVFVTKLAASGNSLVYSTYIGGSDADYGGDIAVDGEGHAYLTGYTDSTDFPTQDPYQIDQPSQDAFVTKLSVDGSSLVYSTYLGASGSDIGTAIAVDGVGSAYVLGYTASSSFPTQGPYQTDQGGVDAFVTKLSASGNTLVYSTYLGGSNSEYGTAIAVDGAGSAYVVGYADSANFPTQGPYQTDQGGYDAFVTKLSVDGSALVYSTYLGGSGYDQPNAIAVDGDENAYVTGHTISTDFPTQNPYQPASASPTGFEDAFVTKLSASGSSLVYSTYLGGSGSDIAYGIAVDEVGSAYVTGFTGSSDFPMQEPSQTDQTGDDVFVTKLSMDGGSLASSTYLGGAGGDLGLAIAVDGAGNAYVTGYTNSSDFPNQGPYQTAQGGFDVFVTKLKYIWWLSALDAALAEGDAGTSDVVFTVTLETPAVSTVTVDYFSSDGSATEGEDYLPVAGTLTFLPGEITKPIAVTIQADTTVELDERFFMNLTNATGATISRAQATGAILDDDGPLPLITVTDATVAEGNSGANIWGLPVSLSFARGIPVTVAYQSADGTARASNDYTAVIGTATFAPWTTVTTIALSNQGDTLAEPRETFSITLAGPTSAVIGDGYSTVTINDDDSVPSSTGNLISPRSLHTATRLLDGRVLVASDDSAETFDPATRTWSSAGILPPATIIGTRHTATMMPDGRVLMLGGSYNARVVFDPGTEVWSTLPELSTPRSNHTMTLLNDGRALIVGGTLVDGVYLDSAEIYSSSAGGWLNDTAESLASGRAYHTATRLRDGRVLVVGGLGASGTLASAYIYDPILDSWAQTGSLTTGRQLQTATLLGDGRVLVAGGTDETASTRFSSCELYDPATELWSATGSLAVARSAANAVLIGTGEVLVTGGSSAAGSLRDIEIYNPRAGEWARAGLLETARTGATATLLADGQVLIVGGSFVQGFTAEMLDPAVASVGSAPTMIAPRWIHTSTLLSDGRVAAVGGDDPSYEVYDRAAGPNGAWANTPQAQLDRRWHTSTLLPSGALLVAGGTVDGVPVDSAGVLTIGGGWSAAPPMSEQRAGHTATLLGDGRVLVAGGYKPGFAAASSAELFDPVTSSWSYGGTPAKGRLYGQTATKLRDGTVLVVGGFALGPALRHAEIFDPLKPAASAWRVVGAPNFLRGGHIAVALRDGRVLIAGGRPQEAGTPMASAEVWDPATVGDHVKPSRFGPTRAIAHLGRVEV